MMRQSNSKEIRARVDAIYRDLLKTWHKANPLPGLPKPEQVAKEIASGKAKALMDGLTKALSWVAGEGREEFEYCEVFDCISTPSMDRVKALMKARTTALATFKAELDQAKEDLLDRVLFDGDAPYHLIQAFRKWKDSKAKAAEPFDGR